MSGCDPDSIIHDHPHQHSLMCDHRAYYDSARSKVMYLHDDEFHENCDDGHTHLSKICLQHEFTKVAKPGEDCSARDDCHVHIRDDGVAELHHPADPGAKKQDCQIVAKFRPLT